MNPSKITIDGNYWDCQIYRGRLYLFTIDGSLKIVNWNALIESLQINDYINVALSYAFKNGRELYSYQTSELLSDIDIKALLKEKFEALRREEIIISKETLDNFLITIQQTPFKELHTDSEIFSNRLFTLTHNSLLSTSIHTRSKKYSASPKALKHFDLYAFSLKANKYARIAISAGDDGLMEYNASFNSDNNLLTKTDDKRMRTISSRHSSFADYSFLSIYNSSIANDSFLAYQTWNSNPNFDMPELIKEQEFSEKYIFKNNNSAISYLSWGASEKIYRAIEGGFEIVRFNNYAKEEDIIFSDPKFIPLQPWKGKILSASIAYFGTILHCENAVVVMLSDGTFYNIPGEISRFRIFPRSINYENHLHIIHDDRLEIYSFNNDYFVNQKTKNFGIAFRTLQNYSQYNRHRKKEVPDAEYYNLTPENKSEDTNINLDDDLPF